MKLAAIPSLLCLTALLACHRAGTPGSASPASTAQATVVKVDNRGFLNMTIYVLDHTQRVRLGTANGNQVTPLTIPSYLVLGPVSLRFLCDPIGSERIPVSEEITVVPGDEVLLIIPGN